MNNEDCGSGGKCNTLGVCQVISRFEPIDLLFFTNKQTNNRRMDLRAAAARVRQANFVIQMLAVLACIAAMTSAMIHAKSAVTDVTIDRETEKIQFAEYTISLPIYLACVPKAQGTVCGQFDCSNYLSGMVGGNRCFAYNTTNVNATCANGVCTSTASTVCAGTVNATYISVIRSRRRLCDVFCVLIASLRPVRAISMH